MIEKGILRHFDWEKLRVRLAELLLSRNNWTRKRFNLFFYLHVQKIIEVFSYLNTGRLSINIPHQSCFIFLGSNHANAFFFFTWIIFIVKSFIDVNTHTYEGIQILNGLLKFRAPSRISNINQLFNCSVQYKYLYLIVSQLSPIVL